MKNFVVFIFAITSLGVLNAQTNQQNKGTSGTNVGTNNGTININYPFNSNNSSKGSPCDGKTTGNILVKNNSNKILYLFFNTANNEFTFVDPITIKPFESELLYDLPIGQTQLYKAVTSKPASRTSMHYIQAETTGRFSPDPCSTREFIIDL